MTAHLTARFSGGPWHEVSRFFVHDCAVGTSFDLARVIPVEENGSGYYALTEYPQWVTLDGEMLIDASYTWQPWSGWHRHE